MSHRDQFNQFLEVHPEAWVEFCKRVDQLWARGIRHYSADGICHVLRFHTTISGEDMDNYKINNNYSAFFARKYQEQYPERAAFFETRRQKV